MKQPMDKSRAKKNVVSSQTVVEKLIVLGKKQGYLTYDEVNEHIPGDLFGPDQIDGILQTLGRRSIRLVAKKEDLAAPESAPAAKKVDSAKDKKDDNESYRTNRCDVRKSEDHSVEYDGPAVWPHNDEPEGFGELF